MYSIEYSSFISEGFFLNVCNYREGWNGGKRKQNGTPEIREVMTEEERAGKQTCCQARVPIQLSAPEEHRPYFGA